MIVNELNFAKELIRRPSITPNDAGTIKLLSKKLKQLGFNCRVMEFRERGQKKVKNLYARLGKSSPNFCFAGHTDVVPPGNFKLWTTNPFSASVKKNKLIGRGASDMKGSIACFLSAVSEFKKIKPKFSGSISFLITADEEGLAINGTKKVVEKLKKEGEKINFCLVGEPTNQDRLGQMMKIGRRGSLTGHLEVIGVQGHVAYPRQANNPANTIVKILKEIKKNKLDSGTKNFQASNLEVTKINIENSADNVIPSNANATFNVRYNDKHTANSLKNKFNKIFKKFCKKNKCSYKISYQSSGDAFLTKPGKITYMIKNVIKKITKINPKLSTSGGTSDARFIRKISPCVEFGLVGKTMHKINENILISDLRKLKKIYFNILVNYF